MIAYYFTAPWCGPCKTFKPRAEEILKESKVSYSFVDVDVVPETAHEAGVMSLPTIVFYDGTGLESARVTGANERGLREAIRQAAVL